jgi:hypothetical protein
MLYRVALVRTDVSEEPSASFIRVTGIGELGATPAATSNQRTLRWLLAGVAPSSPIPVTLMKEALGSSETSVLTRATRRNIPEGTILQEELNSNLGQDNAIKTKIFNGFLKFLLAYVGIRPWLLPSAYIKMCIIFLQFKACTVQDTLL